MDSTSRRSSSDRPHDRYPDDRSPGRHPDASSPDRHPDDRSPDRHPDAPSRRRALAALGLAGMAVGASTLTPGTAQARPATDHRRRAAELPSVTSVADLRGTAGTSHGEQVYLRGYHADRPGLGGGVLYWDATATEADNGGTILAVTGQATGRWRRPVGSRVDLAWFGWTGDGTENDSPRVQAAVDALPTGGTVEAGPGRVRLEQTIRVTRVPVIFQGAGVSDNDEYSTQYIVATGAADGFRLAGVRGGGLRDLQVRGSGLTGGSMVATERDGTDGNYMLSFANVRFKDGYNGLTLRGCNTVRFVNCVWNGFTGQQVILLNGVNNDSRADPVEFVQCGISAGTANHGTDNLVIDGLGGSIKFIATAILFGRHGIWLKNTTGGSYPKFLYFEGGGFENARGVPVLLEAGAQTHFTNTYISADNDDDAVRIGAGFTGSATFSNSVIRGCGRHGLDIGSTRVTVTGCLIGNNGRTAHPSFARTVTAATANGAGRVRLTTSDAHGWETGDRISVQDVAGTTEANGKWRIEVVSPTQFDLPEVTHTHGYTGGGTAFRNAAGINIRSSASRVVVVGNAIGALADGISRQDYGVVCAATDVLVADNDLAGNTAGPYQLVTAPTAQTRFTGNKGVEQVDGWLTARIPGAVTDGSYDFGNLLYLDGQRITVVKVTRRLAEGGCQVRLDADGASAGGAAVAATTAVQTTRLAAPFTVDGVGGARRLQLRVLGTAAAAGLEVQFGYQVVS
ncbi:ubiquitin-activating E1 FCCH domain-containing protein [Plantactinospora sp. B5E13]|uniref:ubiquitin-activating E1 FCCH domain-containing protein n=1 Tax=unclassified Plantactinospora TaxID=2631981 RepID=UPI00325DC1F3